MARLSQVLRGSPEATGTGPLLIQALAIILWFLVVPVTVFRSLELRMFYVGLHPPLFTREYDMIRDGSVLYGLVFNQSATYVVLPLCLLVSSFAILRFGPPRPRMATVVRSHWRACLWASLVVPLIAFSAIHFAHIIDPRGPAITIALLFMLTAPAALSLDERERRRRSNWQPVCPECGYSVRFATTPRCAECGVLYLSVAQCYRRWAIRRIEWDRQKRGMFLVAYGSAIVSVIAMPCYAAWRLSVPDRLGRAARWAVAHALLLAMIAALTSSLFAWHSLWVQKAWNGFARDGPFEASATSIAFWTLQSVGAWLCVIAGMVAVGAVLSYAAPQWQASTRLGLLKWGLYALPALLPAFVVCALAPGMYAVLSGLNVQSSCFFTRSAPNALAVIYGAMWSFGGAANPYARARGWRVWTMCFGAYLATWFLLTHVLLRLDGFQDLL